jgi:hypothetical protein
MKHIEVKDETHAAYKAYCAKIGKEMKEVADGWIATRLLEEAGGTRDNPS